MNSNPINPHINAEIIKDSVSPAGKRLTTFILEYPRWIHSEIMTHRMMSRNASSSRAIPVNKIIQQVIDTPAVPVKWVKNQAGMQGYEEVDPYFCEIANGVWLEARDAAVKSAKKLVAIGIHKQLANRLLEPFHHIKVVLTATEFQNFFALRMHQMAEDNFQALVSVMAAEFLESVPKELKAGEWHLPFVSDDLLQTEGIKTALKCSTARCARVSYMNHDGSAPDIEKDIKLHDDLVVQKPLHACYDDQTEIMTDQGWQFFSELKGHEKIAAVNPYTRQFKFENAPILEYDFSGQMVLIENEAINLLVTPNHRMLFQKRRAYRTGTETVYGYTEFKIQEASQLTKSQTRYLSGVVWEGGSVGSFEEGAYLGFCLGDGFRQKEQIVFHLSKQRKIHYITSILTKLGFDFKITNDVSHKNSDTVFIKTPRHKLDLPKASEKELPDLFDKSKEYLQGMFEGLMNSDGSKHYEKGYIFSTTSKKLADGIQTLASLIGREVRTVRVQSAIGNKQTCYVFNVTSSDGWKTTRDSTSSQNYSGKVYCSTVSTGMLLVRRNGRQVVCGNSPAEHQGQALADGTYSSGNFVGFIQYRKMLAGECATKFPWE